MPRDVSGNYTLAGGNPVVTATLISSVWANNTLSDLATAMTNSLDRTGVSAGMTGQFKAAAGTAGAPGISFQLEPTSGFYRNAAGDIRFAVAGVDIWKASTTDFNISFASVQAADFQATQHTMFGTAVAAQVNFFVNNTSTVATQDSQFQLSAGSTSLFLQSSNQNRATTVLTGGATTPQANFYTGGAIPIQFGTNSTLRATIDGAGRWTWAAPTSAGQTAFTFNGITGNNVALFQAASGASNAFGVQINAGTNTSDRAFTVQDQTAATAYFRILGNGECYTLQPPAATGVGGMFQVGYADMPLNSQAGGYTLVIGDRSKMVMQTAVAGIIIPANSGVAFPIGTVIMLYNNSGSPITISITTDTLTLLPSALTGARTLASQSIATIWKVAATSWRIWGFGLS